MAAHRHEFGPIFVHVETEKRRCITCGYAVPVRLVQPDQIRRPEEN
jgi:hypothetical protein